MFTFSFSFSCAWCACTHLCVHVESSVDVGRHPQSSTLLTEAVSQTQSLPTWLGSLASLLKEFHLWSSKAGASDFC